MLRKALLLCGILSSLLYVATVALASMGWNWPAWFFDLLDRDPDPLPDINDVGLRQNWQRDGGHVDARWIHRLDVCAQPGDIGSAGLDMAGSVCRLPLDRCHCCRLHQNGDALIQDQTRPMAAFRMTTVVVGLGLLVPTVHLATAWVVPQSRVQDLVPPLAIAALVPGQSLSTAPASLIGAG